MALALHIRFERAADVGAFVPAQAEPAQVFDCGFGVLGTAAVRVEVFHAQDESAACLAGAFGRGEEGKRMAYMQIACGRGRKTTAIAKYPLWKAAGHAAPSVARAEWFRLGPRFLCESVAAVCHGWRKSVAMGCHD